MNLALEIAAVIAGGLVTVTGALLVIGWMMSHSGTKPNWVFAGVSVVFVAGFSMAWAYTDPFWDTPMKVGLTTTGALISLICVIATQALKDDAVRDADARRRRA